MSGNAANLIEVLHCVTQVEENIQITILAKCNDPKMSAIELIYLAMQIVYRKYLQKSNNITLYSELYYE